MPGGGWPHWQQEAGFWPGHGGGVGVGVGVGSGVGVGVGSLNLQVLPVGSSHVHIKVGSDSAGQFTLLV